MPPPLRSSLTCPPGHGELRCFSMRRARDVAISSEEREGEKKLFDERANPRSVERSKKKKLNPRQKKTPNSFPTSLSPSLSLPLAAAPAFSPSRSA